MGSRVVCTKCSISEAREVLIKNAYSFSPRHQLDGRRQTLGHIQDLAPRVTHCHTRGAERIPLSCGQAGAFARPPVSWHHAHLCVPASNCHESMYVKLVEALCAEQQTNLFTFHDNKERGRWAGLGKDGSEGKRCGVDWLAAVVWW